VTLRKINTPDFVAGEKGKGEEEKPPVRDENSRRGAIERVDVSNPGRGGTSASEGRGWSWRAGAEKGPPWGLKD